MFRFKPERRDAFFRLLPRSTEQALALARRRDARMIGRSRLAIDANRRLRHAVEIRHPSFMTAQFVRLLRKHGIGLVVADTAGKWPKMLHVTADFVYVRLHGDIKIYTSGYSDRALASWARRIRKWDREGRDVYVYFDNRVTVLEQHADFLRDFRGDTIHPSTLQVLHELGLAEAFLRLPHTKVPNLAARYGEREFPIVDLHGVGTRYPFIAMIPQWDFLDFLAQHARAYRGFELRLQTEATGLVSEAGRVTGVETRSGPLAADLVVAADGRHSTLRAAAGLEVLDLGAPIDVLWFRLSRRAGDEAQTMVR